MKLKAAIFDMDGTLLDSMWIWDGMASHYLRALGQVPPAGLDDVIVRLPYYERISYLQKNLLPSLSFEEIEAGIHLTVTGLYREVVPKEGVCEMLSAFSAAGIPMAVATLSEREKVEDTLSRLGLLHHFSSIFTCREVGAPKSSPVIYEAALSALGAEKAATPVFEDAFYAVKTAHRAGFPVFAVYDKSPECRFEEAARLATLAIRDYREIDWEAFL